MPAATLTSKGQLVVPNVFERILRTAQVEIPGFTC